MLQYSVGPSVLKSPSPCPLTIINTLGILEKSGRVKSLLK